MALHPPRRGSASSTQARRDAAKVVEEAQRQGEAQMREAEIAAREKLLQARSEFEKVSRKRRTELEAQERRLTQKEDNLDKRTEELTRRDKDLSQLDRSLVEPREERSRSGRRSSSGMFAEERTKLEQIAGLTAQQAREELVRVMEDEARIEAAHIVKRIEDEAREQADKQAQRDHRHGHPARRLGLRLRDHGLGGHAAQRRDEGPHHRPRGPQHPRPGDWRPAST